MRDSVGAMKAGVIELGIQACNFILACYAVSLVNGETLHFKKICHTTLKGYTKMTIKCHTNQVLPSPCSAPIDFIEVILEAVKKI